MAERSNTRHGAGWPLWLAIVVAIAGVVALVSATYFVLVTLLPVTGGLTLPQALTAALATATALGATIALVVNVRRQGLNERMEKREIGAAFTEGFRAASVLMGGATPVERIAGVYAMASLADEYPARAQQCVDVLCGYLRLPFVLGEDAATESSVETTTTAADGTTTSERVSTQRQPRDGQVRSTIVVVMTAHLQADARPSWSHLQFDFSGATLENASFLRAVFYRDVVFSRTTFYADSTDSGAMFVQATFHGDAWFDHAAFFCSADFRASSFFGVAWFTEAVFTSSADFVDVVFTNGDTWEEAISKASTAEASHRNSADVMVRGVFFYGTTFDESPNFASATLDGAPYSPLADGA